MARQYGLIGFGPPVYINETAKRQYAGPGFYVDETQSSGSTVSVSGVSLGYSAALGAQASKASVAGASVGASALFTPPASFAAVAGVSAGLSVLRAPGASLAAVSAISLGYSALTAPPSALAAVAGRALGSSLVFASSGNIVAAGGLSLGGSAAYARAVSTAAASGVSVGWCCAIGAALGLTPGTIVTTTLARIAQGRAAGGPATGRASGGPTKGLGPMGARRDWTFDIGEDWSLELACFEADGVTPLDLTGATVHFRVGLPDASTKDAAGAVQSPAAAGVVFLILEGSDTAAIPVGRCSYTVRATLQDGRISDQLFGFITARATEFAPA